MKFSMRVKLVAVLSVLAVMLAGSAWADASTVKTAISNYGLSHNDGAGTAQNPIIITGTKSDASAGSPLDLNIAGLTIEWRASLAGTSGGGDYLVRIAGANGVLKITGGTITFPANIEVDAFALEDVAVEFTGGTISGGATHTGFGLDYTNSNNARVTINGGTFNMPRGWAILINGVNISERLKVDSPSTVNGLVTILHSNNDILTVDLRVYGNADIGADNKMVDPDVDFVPRNFDIYGTVTVEVDFDNRWTINNHSGNTLNNQGTLTNNGTINNTAKGKITNTGTIINTASGTIVNEGTIDNTSGTITNDGIFRSVQTAAQMGGTINGSVTPISSGGSSGGCNAGFGMIALLLAGFALTRKSRKA